jgi:hypothetical protein
VPLCTMQLYAGRAYTTPTDGYAYLSPGQPRSSSEAGNLTPGYRRYAREMLGFYGALWPFIATLPCIFGGVADGTRTHDNRNHNPECNR